MDSEEVYLTIYINFNGKEFSDKTTCLPSLEEIKNKSKIEFNISEEDLKNIKFRYQNEKNEFLDIKKDLDLIFNAKENNEYDFEIKLDIIIDTAINIDQEKNELINNEQNNNKDNNIISEKIVNDDENNINIGINNSNIKNDFNIINDAINNNNNGQEKILDIDKEKKEKVLNDENKIDNQDLKDDKIKVLEIEIKNNNENEEKLNKKDNIENSSIIIDMGETPEGNEIINQNIDVNDAEMNQNNVFEAIRKNINNLKVEIKNSFELIKTEAQEKPKKLGKEVNIIFEKILEENQKDFDSKKNSLLSYLKNKYVNNNKYNIKEKLNELLKEIKNIKNKAKNNKVPNINNIKENDYDNFRAETPYGNKNFNPYINNFHNN